MNIFDFQKMKQTKTKISMVTCYDNWSAKIIAPTNIDCVLVGDSLAMVMHGHATTIQATVELMCIHTRAVAQGAGKKFIITDMPFLVYQQSRSRAIRAVQKIIQAGAQAIKIENTEANIETIRYIVASGVPVIGHLGLTLQTIHQMGGFRVQGRDEKAAAKLFEQALMLEEAGCFAVVLEGMPNALARKITERLTIPTIGIGAGPDVDGQVLVLQDLLGVFTDFKPKFVKSYLNGAELMQTALNNYNDEVKKLSFPTVENCYE
jgi:3-methyl-2-oxobutanoate hydroxymethyltransferase